MQALHSQEPTNLRRYRTIRSTTLAPRSSSWALALALAKQLVNASLDGDRAAALAAEATAQEINMGTADANEGVASFVERRKPTYTGR